MDVIANDTLVLEVPYMKEWNFPVGTLFRIVPTQYATSPTAPDNAVFTVLVESVPRPADRPVSAKMYPDNGYDRVVLDMPAEVAVKLRGVLGKIGGGYGDFPLTLDPGLTAAHRDRGTDLIWSELDAQGI